MSQLNGNNKTISYNGIFATLVMSYGPIAFGLIAVLIIWQLIVGPTLDKARVDANSFNQTALIMREAAEANRNTASALKTVTENLLKLEREINENFRNN